MAFVSEIHGNLPALEAAFADAKARGVDQVICAGDMTGYGPFSDEVCRLAIGTALSSAAYHSMESETKCQPTEVTVNEITYLKCGDNWYNRVMQGGQVNYVVVAAPPGF